MQRTRRFRSNYFGSWFLTSRIFANRVYRIHRTTSTKRVRRKRRGSNCRSGGCDEYEKKRREGKVARCARDVEHRTEYDSKIGINYSQGNIPSPTDSAGQSASSRFRTGGLNSRESRSAAYRVHRLNLLFDRSLEFSLSATKKFY